MTEKKEPVTQDINTNKEKEILSQIQDEGGKFESAEDNGNQIEQQHKNLEKEQKENAKKEKIKKKAVGYVSSIIKPFVYEILEKKNGHDFSPDQKEEFFKNSLNLTLQGLLDGDDVVKEIADGIAKRLKNKEKLDINEEMINILKKHVYNFFYPLGEEQEGEGNEQRKDDGQNKDIEEQVIVPEETIQDQNEKKEKTPLPIIEGETDEEKIEKTKESRAEADEIIGMIDDYSELNAVSEKEKEVENEKTKGDANFEKIKGAAYSRAGSKITLELMDKDDYEDLRITKQEGDEKNTKELTERESDREFIKKTRELWKHFAIHGIVGKNSETGELELKHNSDLDGKGCLELLRLAGIDPSDLEYVEPGQSKKGRINLDTGGKHGIVVDSETETFFIDHHADDSPQGTSATKFTFRMLRDMNLLKKSEEDIKKLEKMVDFINAKDNGEYPQIEKYFENSWKTIYGLVDDSTNIKVIEKFFLKDGDPDPERELSEGDLKNYGLFKQSGYKRMMVVKEKETLEWMKENGFIVNSKRYGNISVGFNGDIFENGQSSGFLASRAFGCDSHITWDPDKNKLNISTRVPITDEFSQGKRMRETMWVRSRTEKRKLDKEFLNEILSKMTDGKLKPEGKLKEYLENGKIKKEVKTFFYEIVFDKDLERVINVVKKFKEEVAEIIREDEEKDKKEGKKPYGRYEKATMTKNALIEFVRGMLKKFYKEKEVTEENAKTNYKHIENFLKKYEILK